MELVAFIVVAALIGFGWALVRPFPLSGWEAQQLFPVPVVRAHAPNMDRRAVAPCPSVDPIHCAGAGK